MDLICQRHCLHGLVCVPGSKSHTIRALILAAIAQGTSSINNPLLSEDCLAAKRAIQLIGAKVEDIEDTGALPECAASGGVYRGDERGSKWIVTGAGKDAHLPVNVVDVGDSGSLLYFMTALAATFDGWSIFTGDEAIRKRPVAHVVDALRQLGAEAHTARPGVNAVPLLIKGRVTGNKVITAGSVSSQYITGLMMAGTRMKGGIDIELTDPKETPYLTMTRQWLESLGVEVSAASDFHHISVKEKQISAFERTMPSDWEAAAFPIIAALIGCGEDGESSTVTIQNVDGSGSQGDDAIVRVLQSVGADIKWNREKGELTVKSSRLSTQKLPGGELHVNISSWPDGICALAAAASVIEGVTIIEDAAVCRKKECDRIAVMRSALESLGVEAAEGPDCLIIRGHSPVTSTGAKNTAFSLHGGEVSSHGDHRVAMSLASLALALPKGQKIEVKGAECCAVSFPRFIEVMNGCGAGFEKRDI